jgi:serine/threonine protein kinase
LLEGRARGVSVRELAESGLDAPRWVELARASSGALARLHALRDERGDLSFVHGDVSPDNVFFDAPAGVTFVDLSSATFRDAAEPVFPGDRGTLPYVAPEIARGEARPAAASDTYALAATLLAAAIGRDLVDAATEASRLLEIGTSGVRAERIDRRSDLPERARDAIRRALRFDPALRLASSLDLARELGNQVG